MHIRAALRRGQPVDERRRQLLAALVTEPMSTLQYLLVAHPASSLRIADATGVPGSIIRSVRNASVKDVRTETWSRLLWWLLETCEELPDEVLRGLPKHVPPTTGVDAA